MGTYRAPGQVLDTTFNQLNQIVAGSITKFDTLFAEKKKEQKIQMEKNEKIKEKNALNRANSYANWNKELRRVTPATGFSDENTQQLEAWSEEYYSLSGKTDLQSLKRMAQLMSLPSQIANGAGAMTAINKRYTTGKNIQGNGPKTIDFANSNEVNMSFMDGYNDLNTRGNIHTKEIGGKIYYEYDGQTLDNSAFVEGALEGSNFILFKGSQATAMDPIIKGKKAEMGYENGGVKQTDDTNNRQRVTGMDNTENNKRYSTAMRGQDYDPILNDGPYMTSIFEEQIDALTKEAEMNPTSEAARLLYGEDMKKGEGGDDYTDLLKANNVNSVGPYVGNNPDFGNVAIRQKEIASEAFYLYSQKDNKPDYVDTGLFLKNQTPAKVDSPTSDYTPAVDRAIDTQRNRDLYRDNQRNANRIAMAAKSKKTGKGVGKKVASELLVKELNTINQNPVFKDNIRKGKYAILTEDFQKGVIVIEKGKIVFLPTDNPDEPKLIKVDLTNSNDINEILTIEGSGMTTEVYDGIGSRHRYNEYEYEWVKTSKGPKFVKKISKLSEEEWGEAWKDLKSGEEMLGFDGLKHTKK